MTSGGERGVDTSRAHPARRYNYWLGGKDHFQADRESAAMIEQMMPTVAIGARENRRFHGRVVERFLAGLDPVPPGVCSVADWRPSDPAAPRPTPAEVCAYGGVARLP